jgi:hypothetical protein
MCSGEEIVSQSLDIQKMESQESNLFIWTLFSQTRKERSTGSYFSIHSKGWASTFAVHPFNRISINRLYFVSF